MNLNTGLKTLLIGAALAASSTASALPSFIGKAGLWPTQSITATIDTTTGFQTPSQVIRHTYVKINGTYVQMALGTQISTATLTINGVERSYTVIKPNPVPANAPVVLMLHGNGSNPQQQANLSLVSDFVATQQFWAVLPAAINGVWGDDPSRDSEDDVNFISALIDTLVSQGVDQSRVYASGFSNGAFMTERLACELSDKIAAFSMVSATMRTGLVKNCQPAYQRSKLYILGTADSVVHYDGLADMESASDTLAFWMAQQGCGGVVSSSLPALVDDGTSVQLDDYTGCSSGTSLRLYTVNGGGHAWPGGFPDGLGTTSQNIDADGLIWLLSSAASTR